MYRVIIAGSRDFNNYALAEEKIHHFLRGLKMNNTEIVSGGARGADTIGEKIALKHKVKLSKFPAKWNEYGKSAGHIRNAEMAKYADACIVFWDGESRGTKGMIDLANRYNLDLEVVKY